MQWSPVYPFKQLLAYIHEVRSQVSFLQFLLHGVVQFGPYKQGIITLTTTNIIRILISSKNKMTKSI